MSSAQEYIQTLGLQRHPEGGYFAECYRSQEIVNPTAARYQGGSRCAGTSIYYLLEKQDFSAWHKVNSDELWHHYQGCAMQIYQIDPAGQLSTVILGNPAETPGAHFQTAVPAGYWFAVELMDKSSFGLVGCTVAPGFEFADFELAKRDKLIKQFPVHADLIKRLYR
jgi:predicted cupin superfamily sugar epimerase